MTSPRRMTIPDLVADPALIQRLIDEGETLFVERKERDPARGLGPTVASFANMLGGWLLIGVDDDGRVVGYSPPGRADLQDHIRNLLQAQVDPMPPFAAITMQVSAQQVGVVRVAESSDTPHITSDGVIYVRNPGGKQRVTDHRDILAMALRGDEARQRAADRQYGLPLIEGAMRPPQQIFGEPQLGPDAPPFVEFIVRAAPYTVPGAFADRALSAAAADLAKAKLVLLFPGQHVPDPRAVHTSVEPRARGLHCIGGQRIGESPADIAIDAGGVVAARRAWRRDYATMWIGSLTDETLRPLVRVVADVLVELDGYGRAAVGLEVRGVAGMSVMLSSRHGGELKPEHLTGGERLHVGGDLAVPAADSDVEELADRWSRELARAAGILFFEPSP